MSEFGDYKYNETHLTQDQALTEYQDKKKQHPNAIVTLEHLDCGHWAVRTYRSVAEKEALLRKKLDDYVGDFWSHFGK